MSIVTMVKLTKRFSVRGAVDLDEHTDAVMDELMSLESDTLFDADVSAELATSTVEISVVAKSESFDEAASLADSAIRSAIHATGAHTPEWVNVAFTPTATKSNLVPA